MAEALDMDRLKTFIFGLFSHMSGAVTAGMIHLGDRLGLYQALSGAGPISSAELATKTGLNERWLREWLQQQAGAHVIEYCGDGRFELSAEGEQVLANDNSPAFAAGVFSSLPQQFAVLDQLPESFKTGIGLPYDAFGPEGAIGIERGFAPWFRTMLVPLALPQLDGVVTKLENGANVADIGCGTGVALIEMAKAYPRSQFHGYDISEHALQRARENCIRESVRNVTFHHATDDPLPTKPELDFVTAFDCLHDMTHPDVVMHAIRGAMKDDGTWLIADINAKPTFEENLAGNPMVAMMYGFSVMSCMSSGLSEPGGLGLGTLGFTEATARHMSRAAGFTRFKRHDFGNPINAYYEVRP